MARKDYDIGDMVDTIEWQLKHFAWVEDIIEEKCQMQPAALAHFNEEIKRLYDILVAHLETQ